MLKYTLNESQHLAKTIPFLENSLHASKDIYPCQDISSFCVFIRERSKRESNHTCLFGFMGYKNKKLIAITEAIESAPAYMQLSSGLDRISGHAWTSCQHLSNT